MPSRVSERRSRAIERITNRSRPVADNLFNGDISKGFLFWAADLHLDQTDNPPTQDDLLANITDGAGDLELDAYYVDESSLSVYLFQSKFSSAPGNLRMGDLVNFLDVPKRLTTPQMLTETSNEKVLEFAPEFRRCVLNGYELHLVYLTTFAATKPLKNRAEVWSEDRLTLTVGGDSIDLQHSALIIDVDELIRVIESLTRPREIELDLDIDESDYHQTDAGGFKCLIATISLKNLADIFDTHRFAIFRFNPRGPLGAVNVNKDIKRTLEEPEMRSRFQIMNNGLSAVCTSFSLLKRDDGDLSVNVRDFQIVNGCQTTYTVYDHWRRGNDLGEAKVTLKLVEDPSSQMRHLISSASNKQSQMKDWDFVFDEPIQERLQAEFQELSPPIFYELRRGEYKYIAGQPYSDKATVKDIAQAMWAFIGHPGEAKDKIREIPRSKHLINGPYRQVFSLGVTAERLLLPWLVYKRIQEEWRIYSQNTGERGNFREHGRLHILWLVGRGLLRREDVDQYQTIPANKIKTIADSMDDWFPALHQVAIDTLYIVVEAKVEAARQTNGTVSLRQIFRSSQYYNDFIQRHDGDLQRILGRNITAA